MKGDIQRMFQEHGDAFIEPNREHLTDQHLKIIRSIQRCGTPEAGWIGFDCDGCASPHYVERSCGNRMCPSCQSGKTREWLDRRLEQQLPVHYFLITFTVPEELNPFFIHRPKEGYSALFRAASGALKELATNPRFMGADLPGFFGVLHTWGRTMNFHPHIHFIVPGGGIDREQGLWRNTSKSFYAPGPALARVFKGIFGALIKSEGLNDLIDPAVWQKNWVIDCEAVGQNSEGIVKYLAPYVFKTAITDSRIVSVANGRVTFTYRKSGSHRKRRMILDVNEFIRRYLMHVLPGGFMRIRHYGFMGSGCSIPHRKLVELVKAAQDAEVADIEYVPAEKKPFPCPKCGGRLIARCVFNASGRTIIVFKRNHPKRE